jgi:parvulin-like peptidyl-prolyl isomerase
MAYVQVGDRTIDSAEMINLLAGYRMIPQLLREIILDQAIADVGLTLEERTKGIEHFYNRNQLTTPEAKKAILQRYNMSLEQLEANAIRDIRIEKFKQLTWNNKVESYFFSYKNQLDKVFYSLIRTENPEIAQEIYFRIQAGEQTFAECAKEYSQGVEAQTGGLLGPVSLNQPHAAIAQKLAISQPGELWTPFKLEKWYIIIRLEKLVSAQLDDATRSSILNYLFESWLSEEINKAKVNFHGDTQTINKSNIPQLLMANG